MVRRMPARPAKPYGAPALTVTSAANPPSPPKGQRNQPKKAALWMLGSVCTMVFLAVAGRAAGTVHDTFEMMLYRSIAGLIMMMAYLVVSGRLHEITFNRLPLLTLRNIAHFTAQNLWFYAIMVLPLAQVFALEFTMPIWAMLLAPFIVGEKVTRKGLMLTMLGFAGVVIVTQPFGGFNPVLLVAALSAVGFATSFLITRKLTADVSVISIMFWLHVMQGIMALVFAGYDGQIALPTAQTLWPLIMLGALGLAGHACLTTALSLAPAHYVMPIDYLRLPLAILLGWLIYNEQINLWVYIGSALILLANYLNLPNAKRK